MKRGKSRADLYLSMYPDLHRWLNACVACGRRGYKPDLPENIYPHFNVAATNLRAMFEELAVDENGMCSVCADASRTPR